MIISESNIRKVVRQTLLEFEMGGITMGDFGAKVSHDEGTAGNMKLVVDGEEYNVNVSQKEGIADSVERLDDRAKRAVVKMFKLHSELNDDSIELPVITSGHRSPAQQYNAMLYNWNNEDIGGKTHDDKKSYLNKLYNSGKTPPSEFVKTMHEFFVRASNNDDQAASDAIAYLEKRNVSSHGIGMAFDLRLTNGIDKFVNILINRGIIESKEVKPGTIKEKDHWHIRVKS